MPGHAGYPFCCVHSSRAGQTALLYVLASASSSGRSGSRGLHNDVPQPNLVVYGQGGMGIAVLITVVFGTMGSTAAGMLGLGLARAVSHAGPASSPS